jgi:Kef-type K+ transport system membrane component KefB
MKELRKCLVKRVKVEINMTFETVLMVLALSAICYILSRFMEGKFFDRFKSQKTHKFNVGSALLMGFTINLIMGLFLGIMGGIIKLLK